MRIILLKLVVLKYSVVQLNFHFLDFFLRRKGQIFFVYESIVTVEDLHFLVLIYINIRFATIAKKKDYNQNLAFSILILARMAHRKLFFPVFLKR